MTAETTVRDADTAETEHVNLPSPIYTKTKGDSPELIVMSAINNTSYKKYYFTTFVEGEPLTNARRVKIVQLPVSIPGYRGVSTVTKLFEILKTRGYSELDEGTDFN